MYVDELLEYINSVADSPNGLNNLSSLLLNRDNGTQEKHVIPVYASRLFIPFGEEGIQRLAELWRHAPGVIYPSAIIRTLFRTARKQYTHIPMINNNNHHIRRPFISESIAKSAEKAIYDITMELLSEPDDFQSMVSALFAERMFSHKDGESFFMYALDIIKDSMFIVNQRVINEFRYIIYDTTSSEETIHSFLKRHPSLIDPLARSVISKQSLGLEHVTDFVIKKLGNEYIVVEIERPTTPIFTKRNDFTAAFSHAIGQVIDFQEWIESNIAYAQKHMPEISSPLGLLIIGMSDNLTDFQKNKLRRFNVNTRGKLE